LTEEIAPLPGAPNTVRIDLGLGRRGDPLDRGENGRRALLPQAREAAGAIPAQACKETGGEPDREKARRTVARIYARLADRRRDFQHGRIIQTHPPGTCAVCVESLALDERLEKSLPRPVRSPMWAGERGVRQMGSKAAWYGRTVVSINRSLSQFQAVFGPRP
jgi:putative transposase